MPTTITYNLAPSPKFRAWDANGNPAIGWKVYTFKNTDHDVDKPTYTDTTGSTPNPNPVILDARGEADIYFVNDPDSDNYYLELRDTDDVLVWAIHNYNGSSIGGGSSEGEGIVENYVRNGQFLVAEHLPTYIATVGNIEAGEKGLLIEAVGTSVYETCIDDFWYHRVYTGTASTDNLIVKRFTLGQTEVPGSPVHYLRMACTSGGTSETERALAQFYRYVGFLAGQELTLSFSARSPTNQELKVAWRRNYGTGGSPSSEDEEIIFTQNLTSAFNRYTVTFTLDDLSGKSLGIDNNDWAALVFLFPTNSTFEIDLASLKLEKGAIATVYDPEEYQRVAANREITYAIKTAKIDTDADITANSTLSVVSEKSGWLSYRGNSIGRFGSGATVALYSTFNLFVVLYTTYSNSVCPVSGGRSGGGTTVTEAINDFNSGKTLTMPDAGNRVARVVGGTIANGATAGANSVSIGTGNLPAHTHTHANGAGFGFIVANTEIQVATSGTSGVFTPNGFGTPPFTQDTGVNTTAHTNLDVENPYIGIPYHIHI